MRFERMGEIQESLIEEIRTIRATKGREYATDEDTLADFKEVAAEIGVTPLQVWSTYVKKHLRAIDSYVREGSLKSEALRGRVIDVIVYHMLLLGLDEDSAELPPVTSTYFPVDKDPRCYHMYRGNRCQLHDEHDGVLHWDHLGTTTQIQWNSGQTDDIWTGGGIVPETTCSTCDLPRSQCECV